LNYVKRVARRPAGDGWDVRVVDATKFTGGSPTAGKISGHGRGGRFSA